jgi:hypothetical protein
MVVLAAEANNAMRRLSDMHNPHDVASGLHLMQCTNTYL